MTQARVAEMMGVSQPYVANKLRLLEYTDEERAKITEYGLSERHARAILRLPTVDDRLSVIEKCHAMRLNVARCEIAVDTMLDEILRNSVPISTGYAERIGHFERSLESSLRLLREHGIRSTVKRDKDDSGIYFSIYIE